MASFGNVVGIFVPPRPLRTIAQLRRVRRRRPRALSAEGGGFCGWAISENRYDANGNVIEVRRYDKFLPNARVAAIDTVSSTGITVQEVQGELRTTLGYRDDTQATLASVQRIRSAYDANNRLRITVDPFGSVIESIYDADGNVVGTIRIAGRPTLTEYDESAIDGAVDRNDRNNRVTRSSTMRRVACATPSMRVARSMRRRAGQRRQDRAVGHTSHADATPRAPSLRRSRPCGTGNDEATRLVYDPGGRLRFTIDAIGSVSETCTTR